MSVARLTLARASSFALCFILPFGRKKDKQTKKLVLSSRACTDMRRLLHCLVLYLFETLDSVSRLWGPGHDRQTHRLIIAW